MLYFLWKVVNYFDYFYKFIILDNFDEFGKDTRYCGASLTVMFVGKKKVSVVKVGDSSACLEMSSK